jgi:hypothetical protein
MFKNVNKLEVINKNKKEKKKEKKIIKEGYTEFGHKIKKSRINEAIDTDRYENVVFMQGSDAIEALEFLDNQGEEAALEHLKQWHDYGNHEGTDQLGAGTSDQTFEKDGYIMSYNPSLGYIGLQYEFGNEMGESFDNPKEKDEKYLDKAQDNVQANKYDDGTRYPVEKQLKVADPSLEKMKGDDAPIKEAGDDEFLSSELGDEIPDDAIETEPSPEEAGIEPEIGLEPEVPVGDVENIETDVADEIPLPGAGDEEEIEGGLADGAEPQEFDSQQIIKGMEVEMEHSDDPKVALEIAMDHLTEIPDYYDHLEDMEAKAQGADTMMIGGPNAARPMAASPMDAVDAMGDGQEGEAAEEIPGDDSNLEKEVLWGRMDTIGNIGDDEIDNYEPKGFGEGNYEDKIDKGEYDSNVEELPDTNPLPDEIVDDPDRNMSDEEKGERDYDQARIERMKAGTSGTPRFNNEDTSDETYFQTQSGAVEFAVNSAKERGFEVNDEDIANSEFAEGWVGYENNKRGSIPLYRGGVPQKKMLQISLYRMPSGKYELTHYIN